MEFEINEILKQSVIKAMRIRFTAIILCLFCCFGCSPEAAEEKSFMLDGLNVLGKWVSTKYYYGDGPSDFDDYTNDITWYYEVCEDGYIRAYTPHDDATNAKFKNGILSCEDDWDIMMKLPFEIEKDILFVNGLRYGKGEKVDNNTGRFVDDGIEYYERVKEVRKVSLESEFSVLLKDQSFTSATVECSIESNIDMVNCTAWICYSDTEVDAQKIADNGKKSSLGSIDGTDSFQTECTISGLEFNSDYKCVIKLIKGEKTILSKVFDLVSTKYELETEDIVNVTTTKADIYSRIEAPLGYNASVGKVKCYYSSTLNTKESLLQSGTVVDGYPVSCSDIQCTLTDLNPNTKYYAIVSYSIGNKAIFGDVKSFTTSPQTVTETANCYIMAPGETIEFPLVKGNSKEVLDGRYFGMLWYANGVFAENPSFDLDKQVSTSAYRKDGKIWVKLKMGTTGNLSVGLYDASENIVWSWHIWCVQEIRNLQLFGGSWVMDRNLGAPNRFSAGLMYQWGRKDPFLGPYYLEQRKEMDEPSGYMSHYEEFETPVACTSTTGTVDYSIAHPTTFIKGNDTNKDWLMKSDGTLWSSNKTKYDPCPPGYRVMDQLTAEQYGNGGWGWYGGSYTAAFLDSNDLNLPAAGYYDEDGVLYNVGFTGYFWTTRTSANKDYPDYSSPLIILSPESNKEGDGAYMYWGKIVPRSMGCSVRCQRM